MDIKIIRHSMSHLMAQAVKELYWQNVKMAIWPDIENWFYYDFDFWWIEFWDDNLKELEKKMKQLIKQNQKFENYTLPFQEAINYLKSVWEDYKIELAQDLEQKWEKEISFYKNINQAWNTTFVDMCFWPHVENSNKLNPNAFKLEKVAWAYWKWDSNNKMLTRIYWVAFKTPKELQDYLKMIEEAKKRDHRIIWKKMDIFSFSENVWLWLPLWHPMWWRLWRVIEDYWLEEHKKWWYEFVRTPHIWNKKLWIESGHWGNYGDSMYPALEVGQTLEDAKLWKKVENSLSEQYLLKPMNCPFHVEIFKHSPKSYREFPLRWAETWTVYRYEKKWQLGWLTRVRWFTQDDAHIFCRKDQVKEELERVIKFVQKIIKTFGLEYETFLSFRDNKDSKYIWTDEIWDLSQNTLKEVCENLWLKTIIEEWEAAFYWPKIDFKIKDCLWRSHQCSTIQFDFTLPERFNLTFINKDWKEERPVMIHRALFWSFERFISILIEHYAWSFPLWLAPRQTIIIPVAEKFDNYAKKLNEDLLKNWFRSEIDLTSDSFNKKIRNAETSKINYILIVWEQEEKDGTISIRNYKTKEQINDKIENFIYNLKQEEEKKL